MGLFLPPYLFQERRSPQNYKMHLQSAIDILKAGLPKTLVSIVSPEHVELLRLVNKASSYCTKLHEYFFRLLME